MVATGQECLPAGQAGCTKNYILKINNLLQHFKKDLDILSFISKNKFIFVKANHN